LVVNKLSIKGATPMKTDRYGLGNLGVKREQLENDFPTITGTFDAEYDKTQWYDLFTGDTAKALHIAFEGDTIGSTSTKEKLDIVIPAIRVKKADANVGGPDVVSESVEWEAYYDGTNAPIQITIVSADETL